MALVISLLVACLFIVTFGYVSLCAASPWGTCRRCRSRRSKRTCRACNGTGMRPRLGWQIHTYLTRLRGTR